MNAFNISDKRILVTGGSGSLGRHLIKELLGQGAKSIFSLSRDEGLIKEAREFINSSKVTFFIGDINDPIQITRVLKNINYVFHSAAMKDVVFAEKYPREVLKNNILGVLNILDHSEEIDRFINISSDKAIGVVNCYGASKLMAEYLVKQTNQFSNGSFINIRCPNFLGSRGSVIDVWKRRAKERREIIVTDPNMTRFFITLPEAAKYIVKIGIEKKIDTNKIYYPFKFTKKFRLSDLAKAFTEIQPYKIKIKTLGKRAGEKLHENYVEDMPLATVEELIKILKESYIKNGGL